MGSSEFKNNAHRMVVDGINQGNWDLVRDSLAADLVEHALPPGIPPNRDGFVMFLQAFRGAFPDLTYTVEDELADGDKVMHRVRGHGTMKGDFQGMKANGKKAEWEEMHIARFNAAGKMAEHWATVDQLAMLTQLGFAPGQ